MTWTDTKSTGSTLTAVEYNNIANHVRPTATATVAKSEPADYVTTNYGSDDACIQAAVDYVISLGGGSIVIREGTYSITAKMTVPNDKVTLIGTGKSTIFDIIGSGVDCLEIGTSTRNTHHFNIYDILIEGKSTDRGDAYTTGICIKMINCKECVFENVEIQKGTDGILIHASGTSGTSSLIRFDNVKISFMTGYGVDIRALADGNANFPWNNAHYFSGCYIQHNGVGIEMDRESQVTAGYLAHHSFVNCYIETQYSSGLLLNMIDTDQISFANCQFDGIVDYTHITIDADCLYTGFVNCGIHCLMTDSSPTTYKLTLDNGFYIKNGETDRAIDIIQTGNGIAFQIVTSATTQRAINVYTSAIFAGTNGLIRVSLDNASATGDVLQLINKGTGKTVEITNSGNAKGVDIYSEATTESALNINVPSGAAHMHLVPVAAAPGSPSEGDFYADTDHHAYYYNGTSWIQIA